jgi:RNA polymerase sigma factor (sigma-70 family)
VVARLWSKTVSGSGEVTPEREPPRDPGCVARAWQEHASWVEGLCHRWMRGSADDADEAFARTWARITAFLPQTHVEETRAWIWAVTYRVCMSLHRERKRRREEPIETEAGTPVMTLIAPGTPERDYLTRELASVVADAITGLPDRLSRALCAYLDTRSYEQLARDLQITEVNARKRIQEARAILRGALREYRNNGSRSRGTARLSSTCPLLAELTQLVTPPSRQK